MTTARKPSTKAAYFEKWGSFGTFQTGPSYPIEYILTTFSIAELQHLTFAQKLSATEPDFELLMQRDIDVDRVDKQIVKYLSPEKTEAELRTRSTFFPPLLAAIVPVKGQEMISHLPGQAIERAQIEGMGEGLVRAWGKLVRFSYYTNPDSPLGYELTNAGDGENVRVESFPVKVEIKEAAEFGADEGIRLVVIDGQHRLAAITKLAKMSPEALANLVVPVCLIIAPDSTEARATSHPDLTLTVPRVFRELFVDVNKNAVAVGGHFNSLLSDGDIGKLSVRLFCEQVLATQGKSGLALVEWNIRSVKDATKITRKYSMTSIGVIELALSKAIGNKAKNRGLLKRLLSLGLIETKLYPEDANYEYPNPVEWDRFSPSQKLVLEGQIRDQLIKDGLLRIFFEPTEFRAMREQFSQVVAEYQSVVSAKKDGFEAAGAVLQQVLEYQPISETNHAIQAELKKFGDAVSNRYDANTNGIIRYSIFQRAMIQGWLELIDFLRARDDISVAQITTAYIGLLNFCLKREQGIFSEKAKYLLHSVFKSIGVIKVTEGTRIALTSLIQACLGNKKVVRAFLVELNVDKSDQLMQELFELGVGRATTFATHYMAQRREEFINSWVTDFKLPQDERDELQALQEANNTVRKALREKTATKEDALMAEKSFLVCVNRHVGSDVEVATKDLGDALGYEVEIVLDHTKDGVEEEE